MLELDLKPELEEILELYAKRDGISKGELARRAIAEYLEDREDSDLADEVSQDGGETYSLEEVIRELGLEDKIRGQGKEAAQQAQPGNSASDHELYLRENRRSARPPIAR
jgi:predicted DNA-binding protein